MEKVFEFDSSPDHHPAEAVIITCFDNRIYKVRKAFVKQLGFKHPDVVEVAGGIKAITQGSDAERKFIFEQIRISIALHHARKIVLMPHRDCGAYGGSKNFITQEAEYAFQSEEMEKAAGLLKKEFPGMPVESYLLDFDGAHRA
ncbi:MAG TPA: carbonic anhydrase [Candidatus Paceibacterota bacterium]|nr:carbonic anhydrase [Candidatus Paceibacterota bacterium]